MTISIRARWIEAEALKLKCIGMSYRAIAQHITDVGRGKEEPAVPLPEGVVFRQGYSVAAPSVHEAVKKAMNALPREEAEYYRYLQTERCEDIYLAMQPGIRSGSPVHAQAALKALGHEANINGVNAPPKVQLTGKDGSPLISVEAIGALLAEAGAEEK